MKSEKIKHFNILITMICIKNTSCFINHVSHEIVPQFQTFHFPIIKIT